MQISKYKLIEFIQSKRIIDFFKSRTESEKDMARIAMSFRQSSIINDKKKMGESLNKIEKKELDDFIKLQKKYGFDYLGEISEEEIKEVKSDLMINHGIFVDD